MAEDSNVYPGTSQCHPAKLDGGGSGVYCCILLCKNATYNQEKQKSGNGFFRFPKDKEMKVKWINIIKQFRRSGGADTFKVTSSTVVCEFHFKTSEIKVSFGYGKKFFVPCAVPTIFKFKPKISKARKAPLDCSNMPSSSRPVLNESSENLTSNEMEVELPESGNVPGCSNCVCHKQIENCKKRDPY